MSAVPAHRTRIHGLLAGALAAGVCLLALAAPALATDAGSGFSISVDGERIAGSGPVAGSGAPPADIQVKFDGLDVRPVLNVSTLDVRRTYGPGEPVTFLATLNYPDWVERQEVLVYPSGRRGGRPLAVLPVGPDGLAHWSMPADGPGEYAYVLRVADARGRFDETVPLTLSRSSRPLAPHAGAEAIAPGMGEDRTAVRNIPVRGGSVTVYGTGVQPGEIVHALGETVPVDAEGSFVVQRILPTGDHHVDVQVSDGSKAGLDFSRTVNIPDNEWFYVALGDLTVGKRFGSAAVQAADPSEYDSVYLKGRMAFYLKGKIKGKTLLTAAADTGEGKLGEMFSGLDSKDPRGVLRRIDPDTYYPVYGDDSTAIDDAPTAGKFYVRLERGDSHVMWGRYKAGIGGRDDLLRNDRGLYGLKGEYRSEQATTFGERRYEAKAYAARPGTLPQRDVLAGTGGSAYFLSRQDITRGSETLTVVVSDPVSGRILSRRVLVSGEDYDINALQGVVILRTPLSSVAQDGSLVREGALGGKRVDLVVSYEYTPTAGAASEYSAGGEAGGWIGEHLRLGATVMRENLGTADHTMAGANLRLRATAGTWIDGEYATTSGPGFGRTLSTDGGLTNVQQLAGPAIRSGQAWSLRGELDLADVDERLKGRVGAWYDEKKAGFATFDRTIAADQRSAGLSGSVALGRTELRASLEHYGDTTGRQENRASIEGERAIGADWKLALGLTYTDLSGPGAATATGARLDAGARVTWGPEEGTRLYAFGQATAAQWRGIARNDRVGAGAARKLTDKIGVEAEVSTGTTGLGALAALTYDPTADDRYYLGYRLDPDALRAGHSLDGTDLGGITVGARRRYDDRLTAFAENNYDMFGRRRALTSAYGVTYTPDTRWTLGGALESGDVRDPNASDFQRKAVSLSGGYRDGERRAGSLKGELRLESSADGTRNRTTWLGAGTASARLADDWRLVAGADALVSSSDQSALLDGSYIAANLGFAYRPVANNRLTALAKYQFLHDLPGPQQVTANGTLLGPAQRSHVLSADVSYALNRWLTLGGKYGLRLGQVSTTRAATDFVASGAQLAVVRADVHVLKKWDALLDVRMLRTQETRTVRYGALAGLYHHLGDHMKVGAGYNFATFSDDLTDLTYDDQGVFLNVVGKF